MIIYKDILKREYGFISECKETDIKLITETAHRIDCMYRLTHHIAEGIYGTLYEGVDKTVEFDISGFGIGYDRMIVDRHISANTINTHGCLESDNPLTVTLNIPSSWDLRPKEDVILSIQSTLAHELMHSVIYKKKKERCETKEKINDDKPMFDDAVDILSSEKTDKGLRDFAFAIYSTAYYHERQAFVSECSVRIEGTLRNIISKGGDVGENDIAAVLKGNYEYSIYGGNINTAHDIAASDESEKYDLIACYNSLAKRQPLDMRALDIVLKNIIKNSKNQMKTMENMCYDIVMKMKTGGNRYLGL